MYCTRKITNQITWVGGYDRRLGLFENLFPIPRGITYNSYLIMDEKVALLDTVDSSISRQFLENITHTLNGRAVDYLIVNHMEPDHCSNIEDLLIRYPDMKIVGNAKTIDLIKQFYDMDIDNNIIIVKENESISLGEHTLRFYMTPMVHWPEVMMTYEEKEGILFSADAFGSFGALNGNLFNDEIDFNSEWLSDYRRYYGNIVGKYGMQVQNAIKKVANLEVRIICPLHGPVWRTNIEYLLDKYNKWSTYTPEEQSVALFYGSMYGDTENAINILANELAESGIKNIVVHDVSNTHVSTLIEEVFRCSHIVIAAPTYNGSIYPAMFNFLHDMQALNLQNRTVGLMDNGSWAPTANRQILAMIESMKNMEVLQPVVSIRSALKENTREQLMELKDALLHSLQGEE
ncbi:MAG: FprA family A-type flavoprotein [Firmicutes bacterium]|uniref:FprA family A-type flavoprotein n=1 Tax=Candidatus Scybalomonas excrementavium TaxID=2840943 RepID=A0A9D9N6X0_9FIRM|nr:FprA family A-type flavoprotein [Candidatus Scybalomonas excrementavium]